MKNLISRLLSPKECFLKQIFVLLIENKSGFNKCCFSEYYFCHQNIHMLLSIFYNNESLLNAWMLVKLKDELILNE